MGVSLDYLIGFTDAEGSIERRGYSIRVGWSQKESNAAVLFEIQRKLATLGIQATLRPNKKYNGRYEDLWQLRTNADGGRKLLSLIEHRLIAKGYDGMISDQDDPWAYIAGFFDGDGCLVDQSQRGYRYFTLDFAQKLPQVLEDIGGWLMAHNAHIWYHQCRDNGVFHLGVSSKSTLSILKTMLPHLIVKKAHAEDAVEYLEKVAALKVEHGYWYRREMKRSDYHR